MTHMKWLMWNDSITSGGFIKAQKLEFGMHKQFVYLSFQTVVTYIYFSWEQKLL